MYIGEDEIQKEFNPEFMKAVTLVELTEDQLSSINDVMKNNKERNNGQIKAIAKSKITMTLVKGYE